jgi:hypothetical protein
MGGVAETCGRVGEVDAAGEEGEVEGESVGTEVLQTDKISPPAELASAEGIILHYR